MIVIIIPVIACNYNFLKEQDYHPSPYQENCRLAPLEIAWQRANAACLIVTPKEEEERNKRMADIKKQKDKMAKLREQV